MDCDGIWWVDGYSDTVDTRNLMNRSLSPGHPRQSGALQVRLPDPAHQNISASPARAAIVIFVWSGP
jgi:hypothetical protein